MQLAYMERFENHGKLQDQFQVCFVLFMKYMNNVVVIMNIEISCVLYDDR